uniref:aldehyde dehydrogenase family 16 member A1 isoform X2 n=1 Tax=Myxine glutinosa TaxID=7769 RepID=UPI00358FBA95
MAVPASSEPFDSFKYGPVMEEDSFAQVWLDSHGRYFGSYIGGSWDKVDAGVETGHRIYDRNSERFLARVAFSEPGTLKAALDAAHRAVETWNGAGVVSRADHLRRLAKEVERSGSLLAVLDSLENGYAVKAAQGEVQNLREILSNFAIHLSLTSSEFKDWQGHGVVVVVVGTCPLVHLYKLVCPALAAGNAVVLWSLHGAWLSTALFAELCSAAGLPAGVLSLLPGMDGVGADVFEKLLAQPGVSAVFCDETTKEVREAAANVRGPPVWSLPCLTHPSILVLDGADVHAAADTAIRAAWMSQQACGATIIALDSLAPLLESRITSRLALLRLGLPLDKNVDWSGSALASEQGAAVKEALDMAVAEGAKMSQAPVPMEFAQKDWVPPTLLSNVDTSCPVVSHPVRGPVLLLLSARTAREATALARRGCPVSVWGDDHGLLLEVARGLRANTVWINGFDWQNISDEELVCSAFLRPASQPQPSVGSSSDVLPTLDQPPKRLPSASGQPDRQFDLFWGGAWRKPEGGGWRPLLKSGGPLVAQGGRKDIRNAVEAAVKAFSGWAAAYPSVRVRVLDRLARSLASNSVSLSAALAEHKDPQLGATVLQEARRDMEEAEAFVRNWASIIKTLHGRSRDLGSLLTLTLREPFGVLAVVSLSESSFLSALVALVTAISLGNTVVLVPNEHNPLPVLLFCQSCMDVRRAACGPKHIWSGVECPWAWTPDTRLSHTRLLHHASRTKTVVLPCGGFFGN